MNTRYCDKCGAERIEGMKFCGKCGKPYDRQKRKVNWWPLALIAALVVNMISIIVVYTVLDQRVNESAKVADELHGELQAYINEKANADAAIFANMTPNNSMKPKSDADLDYEARVRQAVDLMTVNGKLAAYYLTELSKSTYRADYNTRNTLVDRNLTITEEMTALKEPPERYQELYLSLLELYSDYSVLISYVITPPTDYATIQQVLQDKSAAIKSAALKFDAMLSQVK